MLRYLLIFDNKFNNSLQCTTVFRWLIIKIFKIQNIKCEKEIENIEF
jgi:hypothetical protein